MSIRPLALCLLASVGLLSSPVSAGTEAPDLSQRCYVISERSNELFVIDLDTMTSPGSIDTSVFPGRENSNHMAMVSPDGSKIYISATHQDAVVVVDARTLQVVKVIPVGAHPSHASFRPGTDELWIVNEDGHSVSVLDTATDTVVGTIAHRSLIVPHHVRFVDSGRVAYVPTIGGNQVVVIDATKYEVTDALVASGAALGPCGAEPCGFADAQIDGQGVLYAAHISTNRVLVYDTRARTRLPDINTGDTPWIVFADTGPAHVVSSYLTPNFGDASLTRVGANSASSLGELPLGDDETYGVNYSPLAPDQAFVLNRNKEEVVVVSLSTGAQLDVIPTGGTAETACTTADGRFLVLPLSTVNGSDLGDVVVIDVVTHDIVARFEGVGHYPWSSATTQGGQNYCH